MRRLDVADRGRAGDVGVPGGDRGDDRVVARLRHPPRARRSRRDREHLAELHLQLRLGCHQPRGAAELGDEDVEAGVGTAEGGGVAHGLLGRPRRGAEPFELAGGPAGGGERGGLARHGAAPVGERAELLGGGWVERWGRRVGGDERAACPPTPDLEQARVLEHRERLAQRHARDAERLGQLDLPRQALARREQPGADRLADPAHDLLDRARRLDGREEEVAGDGGGGSGHEKG